jgi:hypothetical protein
VSGAERVDLTFPPRKLAGTMIEAGRIA